MNPKSEPKPRSPEDRQFFSYLRMFLVPTLILKMGLLYFGLNYSEYPGEGYGWGLVATLVLSLVNAGVFLWMNWQSSEEEI